METNTLKIDYDKLTTLEAVNKALKNVQSRKCRAKAMNKPMADILEAEQNLVAIRIQLAPEKAEKSIDIFTMSLDEINRELKNVQSKKCLAKYMGRTERQAEMELLERALKDRRNVLNPKAPSVKLQTKTDIIEKVDELKQGKMSKDLVEFIDWLIVVK